MVNVMQFLNESSCSQEVRLVLGDQSEFEQTYAKMMALDGVLQEFKHHVNDQSGKL